MQPGPVDGNPNTIDYDPNLATQLQFVGKNSSNANTRLWAEDRNNFGPPLDSPGNFPGSAKERRPSEEVSRSLIRVAAVSMTSTRRALPTLRAVAILPSTPVSMSQRVFRSRTSI